MTEHESGLSREELAVFEEFVSKYLPRTSPLVSGYPQVLLVNQTDLPLPRVMQWIHEHAPAIASIPTAEILFNKASGQARRIGRDKILQITLRVVECLCTERDKHSFRLGHNILLVLRGEYMNVAPEVEKLATQLGAEFEVYQHDEWI